MSAGGLDRFRARLDAIDESLTSLLGERFDVCREVALYKSRHDIPMMQPGRVEQVREGYLQRGRALGVPEAFTAAFFDLLIDASCRLEDELMDVAGAAGEDGDG